MAIHKPQNANSSVLSVTTTATKLFDLINAAGSTSLALGGYPTGSNTLFMNVESGTIRVLRGSTPTTSKGKIFSAGSYVLSDISLDDLYFISTSGTASVSILIGTN